MMGGKGRHEHDGKTMAADLRMCGETWLGNDGGA